MHVYLYTCPVLTIITFSLETGIICNPAFCLFPYLVVRVLVKCSEMSKYISSLFFMPQSIIVGLSLLEGMYLNYVKSSKGVGN